jgi:predicted glycoside hydrolase/deacetylase ChbG (UPF0249 family)
MRVIVNADDFGFDDETVDATIDCFARGLLTSATIMPNMPATSRAIAYARAHPEHSFGVHLTYGGDGIEAPVLPPERVPSLVEPSGKLLQSNRTRMLAVLRRIPEDEIERETEAQLQVLLDGGVPLSHVDSHGHIHKFRPFRAALARVLPRFGIRKVRSAQDVFLHRPLKSFAYWLGPHWRRSLQRRFQTTTHFFMPRGSPGETWAAALCARLPEASLEVGVHPGPRGWQRDQLREVEIFTPTARRLGATLIGWRELV